MGIKNKIHVIYNNIQLPFKTRHIDLNMISIDKYGIMASQNIIYM